MSRAPRASCAPRLLAYVYSASCAPYAPGFIYGTVQETEGSRASAERHGGGIIEHAEAMGDLYGVGWYAQDEGAPGATLYMQA